MTLKKQLEKYFQRDELVDIFTRYDLYFHMGLGRLVYQSLHDVDETYKKIVELNLSIDTNIVINALYYILLHHSMSDDFEQKLDYHIRASAMSQALEEFISNDKDLINPEIYAKKMHNEIYEDQIFTEDLKEQFDLEYTQTYPMFNDSITQEVAEHILENVLKTYEEYQASES